MTDIECPCGAVRARIEGEPVAQFYCHCVDCQRVHAAAYVPVSIYRAEQVRVVRGEPMTWALHATPRTTCRTCGTRVFAEPPGIGMRAVMAVLLPAEAFRAQLHMHCRDARLPVTDALPHFARLPPGFGGTDERVEW